ncbi:MAG TPA: hypothetical protein VMT34_12185 [Aggregatilineales bacterium]|nr:hypothetical protein [Aggregatilineales bacterium]
MTDAIPRHLRTGVRAAFLLTVVAGGGLAIALALGAATPPRGDRLYSMTVDHAYSLSPGQIVDLTAMPIPVPGAPFTLDITATFAAAGDPSAAWGISDSAFRVWLYGNSYFSVNDADRVEFIHLHPTTNTLSVAAAADGTLTVRINEELAWQGPVDSNGPVKLRLRGGIHSGSEIRIEHIEIYGNRGTG